MTIGEELLQIVERLPHTVLRRAAVVSPFYEPDVNPGAGDDPPGQAGDESAFVRLFKDFTFEPDAVRSKIVDSWPEDIDDSLARKDWGWKPEYVFDRAFDEYLLPTIRRRYA